MLEYTDEVNLEPKRYCYTLKTEKNEMGVSTQREVMVFNCKIFDKIQLEFATLSPMMVAIVFWRDSKKMLDFLKFNKESKTSTQNLSKCV